MKILLILIAELQCTYSQVTVKEDSLYSESLRTTMKYTVVLPDGYSKGNERYPILYLLHGFGGDHSNWVKLTNLVRLAKDVRIIIVCPDADNSWYANSPVKENANYEDYMINEILPMTEKRYRTIQSKFNRGIAGLSMGGYGAIKFGLKFSSKFCFIGGLSPSMQFPAGLEDSAVVARRSKESTLSVKAAFGETRTDRWNENDVFHLAKTVNPKSLPYFYLSVGSHDGIPEIIDLTHSFAATLRSINATFEMHETAGGHDWKFWDKEISVVLQRFVEITGKKK